MCIRDRFLSCALEYFEKYGINPVEHESPAKEMQKLIKRCDQDLRGVADPAPGRVHGVRGSVLAVGGHDAEYSEVMASDDFPEIAELFGRRVAEQAQKTLSLIHI